MCGIAGWIDSGGVDASAMDRALEALNRRGPDGSGTWMSPDRRAILGHRRLAILDTSSRGEEPSVSPDGLSAFIHNGEIYNFRSLRKELEELGERFASRSDGEVAHRMLRLRGAAAQLQRPADDLAGAAVDDRVQVHPAVLGDPDARHVEVPELARPLDLEHARPPAARFDRPALDQFLLAHHPQHALAVDRDAE